MTVDLMVSVTVATLPHAEPVGEEPFSGATDVAGDPSSPPLGLEDSTVTVRVVVERDVMVVVGSASTPLAEVTALLFPSMSDATALPDSLVA